MNCPNCKSPIDEKLIAKHFASKGGRSSKRALDPETARKMVEARELGRVVERLKAAGVVTMQDGCLLIKRTAGTSALLLPIAHRLESFRNHADGGAVWFRLADK